MRGVSVCARAELTRETLVGWNIRGNFNDTGDAWHYLYTLPPVIVAAAIAAAAAWTDFEVKKMQVRGPWVRARGRYCEDSWLRQPYIDLAHGNSPPHRSLLLDYTRQKYVSSSLMPVPRAPIFLMP